LFAADSGYRASLAKLRQERESALKADGGWLTVTGLTWLKEGDNRIAGVPGVFELRGGRTIFRADRGASVTSAGKPVSRIQVDEKTPIESGSLTLSVIERTGRYGVRIKDKKSKLRAEFHGLRWFPPRESYRIQAKFVPQPKQLSVPN